ncbi:unnamed protein product [Effrenium voratum]|nr:unnamed protein product [Effrenium voratum]
MEAKLLSRKSGVTLNEALNSVAKEEGFDSWSLLASQYAAERPASRILSELQPGDLVLLGARPEHGKTLMALEIIAEAIKGGAEGAFFSLDYNEADVAHRLQSVGSDPQKLGATLLVDTSDEIDARHIIEQLKEKPRGTVIAIDYLQILDQRRSSPEINQQIEALRKWANEAGHIIILISQIDRKYELAADDLPTLADVRTPNPLDLSLFTKSCFMSEGEVKLEAVA